MLIFGTKKIDSSHISQDGSIPSLTQLLNSHNIQQTGRAFLTSIIQAKSEHYYATQWNLVVSLLMRDNLLSAATNVDKHLAFIQNEKGNIIEPKLNSTYWKKNGPTDFISRNPDSSKCLKVVLADPRKNALDCSGLVSVIALLAFHQAAGPRQFNELIRQNLKKERLKITINSVLLEMENLVLRPESGIPTSYIGDGIFRPGDVVMFICGMVESGSLMGVEAAICVGWQSDSRGSVYSEPLFVGGGLNGVHTEADMKWKIYESIGSPGEYGSEQKLKNIFSIKALGKNPTNEKLIELNPVVTRLRILGGRKDLFQ